MSATPYAIELAHAAAHAASQKKASDIIAIDVSQRLALTDVFLVISAGNERQVMAVVDAVEEALHKAGAKRRMREGYSQAHWVLLDYNDIVVHVQREEDREFYAMERLWKDCPQIELPASVLDSE
ncbi:iojap-like protein [Actinomyces graevenitzii F0530]|jgi:iojap-like protein|uniref:Ribosomal silencing factor RsfS n=1 Tax=Actinomyces graevenitzii F0530 TaxID=1321817 RepID=U1PW61_9ACTO|nr:ribosome silencing factor [Actinomyces graevenitzii]ERH14696.1 iojap-like protein [Actinomyces graevenitzii F0530]